MATKTAERITDHLSLPNQQLLNSPQLRALIREFQLALRGVCRGQDKRFGELNRFMVQTDEGHTIDMLDMLHAMDRHPRFHLITQGLDIPQTERQIVTHDIGEPHPKVGDVPFSGFERESEEGKRRKRYEPKIGYILLGKIPNSHTRELARTSYMRVWKRNPLDPEAQLTQLIDKVEGTTRGGLEGIFSKYPKFGYTEPPEILMTHVGESLRKVMIPFCYLSLSLPQTGREALYEYLEEELARMEAAGYAKPASDAREFFGSVVRYPKSLDYCKNIAQLAVGA